MELCQTFKKSKDTVIEGLKSTPFYYTDSEGSYTTLINFSSVKHLIPVENPSDLDFCRWMATKHKIAMFPCSLLTSDDSFKDFARIVIAKSNKTAEKIKERLEKLDF